MRTKRTFIMIKRLLHVNSAPSNARDKGHVDCGILIGKQTVCSINISAGSGCGRNELHIWILTVQQASHLASQYQIFQYRPHQQKLLEILILFLLSTIRDVYSLQDKIAKVAEQQQFKLALTPCDYI